MFENYLKVALRNIKKIKGYSFINIAGLAVGISAFNLIALFVQYELNFDRYHENADRIYRVAVENPGREFASTETPSPLGPILMKEYPEVISTARIFRWGEGDKLFQYGEKMIFEKLYYADPEVFHIFSIPFVKGNPIHVFNEPFSIVMSERLAAKYFGNEDPLGNILILRENAEYGFIDKQYRITGIFKDMPGNSHLRMDLIMPLENLLNAATDNMRL